MHRKNSGYDIKYVKFVLRWKMCLGIRNSFLEEDCAAASLARVVRGKRNCYVEPVVVHFAAVTSRGIRFCFTFMGFVALIWWLHIFSFQSQTK